MDPYRGINALDAVIQTFNAINALRQQTRSNARIHGIITKGGDAPNVIPDLAEAFFYVRNETERYTEELTTKVINCARSAEIATGTQLEVSKNQQAVHVGLAQAERAPPEVHVRVRHRHGTPSRSAPFRPLTPNDAATRLTP